MKIRSRFPTLFLVLSLGLAGLVSTPSARASDISITAANVIPSSLAVIKSGVSAGTITRGQPVIFSTSSNGYVAAKANALGGAPVLGIAVNDVATGQTFQYVVRDPAFALGGTIASGGVVYLSGANSGGVTSTYADLTSGMTTVVLGVGTGSNKINLSINQGGAVP
jgi:hypothetical protein